MNFLCNSSKGDLVVSEGKMVSFNNFKLSHLNRAK